MSNKSCDVTRVNAIRIVKVPRLPWLLEATPANKVTAPTILIALSSSAGVK